MVLSNEISPNLRLSLHAFIWKNHQLLLIKRSNKERYGKGMWDVPGGGIDSSLSLADSLQQEIKEETSLNTTINKPFYAHKDDEPHLNMSFVTIFFKATYI